ncbi:MAG: FmdB family transcriptional regulator [Chloroflexi bacterium]|nr:MAG: FmdB family transcriptional regulator [Chloroflexota bacterium]
MPIYGYRCTECGHELEVLQSMSAEPLKVCSECGGALRKLLYPVGVQFKGSGFYTTDYRNGGGGGGKSKSESESGGGSSESSGGSGSSSSSDSNGSSTSTPEKKTESAASKE